MDTSTIEQDFHRAKLRIHANSYYQRHKARILEAKNKKRTALRTAQGLVALLSKKKIIEISTDEQKNELINTIFDFLVSPRLETMQKERPLTKAQVLSLEKMRLQLEEKGIFIKKTW